MSKVMAEWEKRVAQLWSLPDFNKQVAPPEEVLESTPKVPMVTEDELEQIKGEAFKGGHSEGYDEGYSEGFEKGREEGLAESREEINALRQGLITLLDAFSKPLEQMDKRVEQQLLSLAIAVAKQIVRRELKLSPEQIIALVRESMAALPIASQGIKLYLHPEDSALIRENITISEEQGRWTIVEDPALQRGECRVETQDSSIDGTVDSQIAAIAASILGGERRDDL